MQKEIKRFLLVLQQDFNDLFSGEGFGSNIYPIFKGANTCTYLMDI